jgi:hypothetical protein
MVRRDIDINLFHKTFQSMLKRIFCLPKHVRNRDFCGKFAISVYDLATY